MGSLFPFRSYISYKAAFSSAADLLNTHLKERVRPSWADPCNQRAHKDLSADKTDISLSKSQVQRSGSSVHDPAASCLSDYTHQKAESHQEEEAWEQGHIVTARLTSMLKKRCPPPPQTDPHLLPINNTAKENDTFFWFLKKKKKGQAIHSLGARKGGEKKGATEREVWVGRSYRWHCCITVHAGSPHTTSPITKSEKGCFRAPPEKYSFIHVQVSFPQKILITSNYFKLLGWIFQNITLPKQNTFSDAEAAVFPGRLIPQLIIVGDFFCFVFFPPSFPPPQIKLEWTLSGKHLEKRDTVWANSPMLHERV